METKTPFHTFGIYLSNGQRKPGLIKAFLEEVKVEWNQTEVTLADGSIWPLIRENEVSLDHFASTIPVDCICSFQVYQDGTFFAVARKKGY